MKWLLKSLIIMYKVCISPYMISHCKFIPSCSTYAIDALNKLPIHVAILKILFRVIKCNPLSSNKTHDIV